MNRFAAALVATCMAGPSLAATYDSVALFSADPLAAGAEEDQLRRSGTQLAGRSTSSSGCNE